MIEGKVIRILSARRVVIDVGSDSGVQPQMRLGIYTPRDEIKDPETGEILGQYRARKAIIRAEEVHERFSVAVADGTERRRIRDEERSSIFNFGASRTPRYEEVPARLDIEFDQERPLPTGESVRIGDIVEAPDPKPQ